MLLARGRAFTLIEMIVVIMLIAIVAGIIVPRLITTGEREARAEAEAIASLAGAAARRASTTTQKVALDFSEGSLRVFTLRPRDADDFTLENTRWMADPLLPPVRLEHVRLVSASRDGVGLSGAQWRVEMGGDVRPEVLMTVEAPTGRQWTVLLASDGRGATLLTGEDGEMVESAIDLDKSGRGLTAW